MTPDKLLEQLNRSDPDCPATKGLKEILGGYFAEWLEEKRRRSGGIMADVTWDEVNAGLREAAQKMLYPRSMEGMKNAQRAQLAQGKGRAKGHTEQGHTKAERQVLGRQLYRAGMTWFDLQKAYEGVGECVTNRTVQRELELFRGSKK
jgi:hypothetical protein